MEKLKKLVPRKIQTKIYLFLILLTIFFLIGLHFQMKSETEKIDFLQNSKHVDQNLLLNKAVSILGISLKTLVDDYTYWDEMAKFVKHPDVDWAYTNIDFVLPVFNAQAAWIYDSNLKLVYSYNTLNDRTIDDIPINKNLFKDKIKRNYFQHFFVNTSLGVFEIQEAPIQSEDFNREAKPKGYYFAGRLWSKEYLNDISVLTSSNIKILDPNETIKNKGDSDSLKYINISYKNLRGLNGEPIAKAAAISRSKIIEQSINSFSSQYTITIIFAILILSSILLFLYLFVIRPVNRIILSLKNEDTSVLTPYINKENEFGSLALLIKKFSDQKINFVREINERKIAEKGLRESENLYKTIFEASADAFIILDHQNKVISINESFSRLFLFNLNELQTKDYFSIVKHSGNDSKIEQIINEGTEETIGPFSLKLTCKNNSVIDVDVLSSPIILKEKPYILLRYTDITEIKRLEEDAKKHQLQLQQADKLASLGLLVAGVAHEINNPNTFISVNIPYIEQYFSEIFPILDDYAQLNPGFKISNIEYFKFKEDVKDLILDLKEGSSRITNIVNELKDFAKVESQYQIEIFSFNEVLNSAIRFLSTQIKKKECGIIFNNTYDYLITANKQKLGQVLINVITNSLDAIETKNGKIKIDLELDNNKNLNCTITDNGIGISKEKLNAVFDPFYSSKTSTGGTGLGLSVARSIMESMGFSILLTSEESIGTTVTLTFPREFYK